MVGRRLLVLGGGLGLLLAAMGVGVGLGPVRLGPGDIWRGLTDPSGGLARQVVWELRLPRVVLAALVGANLAVSGALLQGVTRNPLADPHILGISAGAAVVGAVFLVHAPDLPQETRVPLAILGGLGGGAVIYSMAWRGGVSPVRLTLAGVAMSALLLAATTAILASSRLFAQASINFIGGSLFARGWGDLRALWPYSVGGIGLALLTAGALNIMALGEDVATGLGLHTERTRLGMTVIATVLAGAAVGVAGLVGFVGLIIPHVARLLVGHDYRLVVAASALLGALLLVTADTAARNVLSPTELPVGVVTAGIGAPFFLYLVRRMP